MNKTTCKLAFACGLTAVAILAAHTARAQYSPVFFDGFDVSSGSLDINWEYNSATRQGGVFSPLTYQVNMSPVSYIWQQQVTGNPGPLLLAGTVNPGNGLPSGLASPETNFVGLVGGDVVAKRISFSLDVNVTGEAYCNGAGITIGGNTNLIQMEDNVPHFAVRFREDHAFTPGGINFIQFWDGTNNVGNLIPNPAGAAGFSVDLLVDDPSDGNPWDGVGLTKIDVFVNGGRVGGFTKSGGGYTNNFITLEGEWGYSTNWNNFSTAISYFDNLTIYTAPNNAANIGGLNVLSAPTPVNGGQQTLGSYVVPGYNYALEKTASLTAPVLWNSVITNQADFSTGLVVFTNTPSGNAEFFRMRSVF